MFCRRRRRRRAFVSSVFGHGHRHLVVLTWYLRLLTVITVIIAVSAAKRRTGGSPSYQKGFDFVALRRTWAEVPVTASTGTPFTTAVDIFAFLLIRRSYLVFPYVCPIVPFVLRPNNPHKLFVAIP